MASNEDLAKYKLICDFWRKHISELQEEDAVDDYALRQILGSYTVEQIYSGILKVKESDYLMGKGPGGYVSSLHWFLKVANFEKVIGGRFRNKKGPAQIAPGMSSAHATIIKYMDGCKKHWAEKHVPKCFNCTDLGFILATMPGELYKYEYIFACLCPAGDKYSFEKWSDDKKEVFTRIARGRYE